MEIKEAAESKGSAAFYWHKENAGVFGPARQYCLTPMDTPAPRLKLRLLICNPKSYGSKNITCKGSITSGTTPRTKEDPYLPSVFSYECKSEAEWQRLTTSVSRQASNQNAFHAYAHFVDPLLPPGPAGRVLCEAGGEYAPPVPVEVAVAEVDAFRIVTEPEGETVEIVSTSQRGQEVSRLAHNQENVGSNPTAATIQDPARAGFIASGLCSDVVQYNDGRFCNAATEYRFEQWLAEKDAPVEAQPETAPEPIAEPEPESAPVEPEAKPLYSRVWDKLENPMRLKDLAAALEVDAETLKGHLANPNSAVELGHAGWVKRREPKA